jgi:hypothetical protein
LHPPAAEPGRFAQPPQPSRGRPHVPPTLAPLARPSAGEDAAFSMHLGAYGQAYFAAETTEVVSGEHGHRGFAHLACVGRVVVVPPVRGACRTARRASEEIAESRGARLSGCAAPGP